MPRLSPKPVLTSLVTCASSQAQTIASWLSPIDGTWSNAARWSSNPLYPNDVTYDARITATGMAYHAFGSAAAQAILHDLSGWLMMPLALLLLWLELCFLSKLFVYRQDIAKAPLAVFVERI